MNPNRLAVLIAALFALAPSAALAHDDDKAADPYSKLGKVKFANSCSAAVQPKLQRAVAMLHSFWYGAAEPAFEDIAREDPACAIAAWGFASILMQNPLAGAGASPKDAERAQMAIDKGRTMGAKTERERDYLEAVAAYYENFAGRSDGATPYAGLTLSGSVLYGTTVQGGSMGEGTVFKLDVSPHLTIPPLGNAVILSWANPVFTLQAAPEVTGAYTNLPSATSPHTNASSGGRQFFRLIGN